MLFLDSSERLGDFVVNLLYALGCLIGTTHFTTSPDPPQPKFATEVGVMSGVSYEQPIGGKFSLVGKAGVTMLDQGNPWAYSGFQPAAELGLRWYFSGVSPSNANNEGSYLALRSFISYQKMAFWAARPDQYHHVAAFDYSLVWGRTWNLNLRWALKTSASARMVISAPQPKKPSTTNLKIMALKQMASLVPSTSALSIGFEELDKKYIVCFPIRNARYIEI